MRITSITLAAMVLFSWGCQKQENVGEEKRENPGMAFNQMEDPEKHAQLIADLHNEALDYIKEEKDLRLSKRMFHNPGEIERVTGAIEDYLAQNPHIDLEESLIKEAGEKAEGKLAAVGPRLMDNTRAMDVQALAKELEENQEEMGISDTFKNEVVKVASLGDSSVSKLLSYVNGEFSNKNWEGTDATYAEVFVDMVNNSNEYWEDKDRLKCSTWTIINDGIGSLAGLPFGAAGSIVVGTTMSAGTNEMDCD